MDAAEAANGRGGGVEKEKVPFTGLFGHADGTDVVLMLLGTLGSLANGASQPIMTVIFGQVIDAFGGATTADDVLRRVNKVMMSRRRYMAAIALLAYTSIYF
jgi:ATP-binding cassette subfamily B (MDR/TAP) protein 1